MVFPVQRDACFFIFCADGLRDADSRSHGKSHDDNGNHMHNLTADGNGCCTGRAFKLSDDEKICHAVERLQKIR